MRLISTTTSIAIGFACIISSAVLTSHMVGLLPDRAGAIADDHLRLAQVVAAECSAAADQNDAAAIRTSLSVLLANNSEVLSAGVRSPDGKLVIEAGPHNRTWSHDSNHTTALQIEVPVFQKNQKWATIELCFAPLPDSGLSNPLLRLTLFLSASGFAGSLLFLRKALKHLDPSSVVPERVRTMLDALAEGVVIIDRSEQIVMANEAFSGITGLKLQEIQGRRISDFKDLVGENPDACQWLTAIRADEPVRRMTVRLGDSQGGQRTFVLNVVPVLGQDGSKRGLLATFDDMTTIESANAELARSRDEIARQNKELEALASHDSLTGCLNRRAFMHLFDKCWAASADHPIACIMLDIDHFKQVNDRHGHSTGDQVLKQMGQLLQRLVRTESSTCRYGGEEFCILLPGTSFEDARNVAVRIREAIIAAQWPIPNVTASLGVAGRESGAADVPQLLDQADKALYAAKRSGRNRVIGWGDPAVGATASVSTHRRESDVAPDTLQSVANALVDALGQRDRDTGEHCRRVSHIAVSFAKSILPPGQVELLRIAALLHDIGKVAIPDTILRKPGPLSPDEWKVMQEHEAAGAKIVERATGSESLVEIVRLHHAWYAGSPRDPGLPTGQNLPVAARILSMVDAFDAMTSDRVYRKAMPVEKACDELRRCAGTQFDPQLVEQFTSWVQLRPAQLAQDLAALDTQKSSGALTDLSSQLNELANLAAEPLLPLFVSPTEANARVS